MALTSTVQEIIERNSNGLLGIHGTWRRFRLGDIAEVQNGSPYDSSFFNSDGAGMPLLRIRDVGSSSTQAHYSGEYEEREIVRSGDLIVGMDGDFRRSLWAGPPALLNQRVCRINFVSDLVDRRFVFYVLQGYLDAVNEATPSVTVKHLSSKTIADLLLPLPPLPEQQEIVRVLDALMPLVDQGFSDVDAAEQLVTHLKASVLDRAFSGLLTSGEPGDEPVGNVLDRLADDRRSMWVAAHPKKPYREPVAPVQTDSMNVPERWRIISLEAATDPVRVICYGILMPKEHVEDGVLYVKVKDIKNGEINLATLQRTSHEIASKYERASLASGDVLLSIRGTYGRVAIVPTDLEGANITQDTARVAPLPEIDPAYLKMYLSSQTAQGYFDRVARGVAVRGVNIADVRKMPVPVPPIEEQRRIVDVVSERLQAIDALAREIDDAAAVASALQGSILHRMAEGLLVSRASNGETSDELAERIKAEAAARRALKKSSGRSDKKPRARLKVT